MNLFEDASDWISLEGFDLEMPEIDWVDGYTRSDGTFVTGHLRSLADTSKLNNLMNW